MDLDPASVQQMTIAAAFVIFHVLSAGYDLWSFRIPNILPLALVFLFFCAAVPNASLVDWASQLGACALVFLVCAVLFRFRLMGGGDVKLFAATALWAGAPLLLPLVALTALFGGLLVLALKLVAPIILGFLAKLPRVNAYALPQFLAAGREVPYGVAIAGSALMLLYELPPALLSF
jgi:prepilin peptidase CpaA